MVLTLGATFPHPHCPLSTLRRTERLSQLRRGLGLCLTAKSLSLSRSHTSRGAIRVCRSFWLIEVASRGGRGVLIFATSAPRPCAPFAHVRTGFQMLTKLLPLDLGDDIFTQK